MDALRLDLKYDTKSFVGPLDVAQVYRHEQTYALDVPHMKYDPSYVAHIRQYHGGVPGKQWFRTRKGHVYRIGRFLNFATKHTLPPPFQPSWIDRRRDLRLEWSVDNAQSIANIAEGCGAYLIPFGILYAGPHHPDGMDLTHSDLVCFNYMHESGSPNIVVWLNDKAGDECFRCEERGGVWMDMDLSRFTELVAEHFDAFLMMLREHEHEV